MNKQEELLEILIKKNTVSEEKLQEIKLLMLKRPLEEVLLEKKITDIEKITEAKASLYGFAYQSLSEKKIEEQVLNIIPFEVANNYKIISFNKTDNRVDVGLVDPDNFKAIEAVDFLANESGFTAKFFVISSASFLSALRQYKTLSDEISVALKTKEEEDLKEVQKGAYENVEEVVASAPVIKIVSVIIRHAVEGGASDIHIEPLHKETRIRYRVDGILKTSLVLPKNIHEAIVSRIKVMASLKLDETRLPQDGRMRLMVNGKEIDFRISVLPLVGEEKVVMRVLDMSKGAPTLEELGFSGYGLEIIKRNIQKTNKMFLVVGPTGSGKSTTLYAILNLMNKEGINISTLEDPVEYYISGVNHSQTRPEIGFNFASGLRSLLRQDPDVIMVGEIRDDETAELAIHSGLTGHFVLSTMHTNDAFGAIPRLLDMKVEPFLLGSTLNTVVAQRLARKICNFCKVEDVIPGDLLSDIKNELNSIPQNRLTEIKETDLTKLKFYKGNGCARCGNTGYSGRVAISEVIDIDDKLADKITSNEKSFDIKDVRASQNFISIKQDGIIKVLNGITTIEEVLRVMRN
ncbi:MAG: type II secretion system protein E [Parcubacteria group bacterium GW2011_GWE2_39_37]|uniref:Type II secretion system protein E n=1 Tax=Candidatus Falkowbacteria bacterium GW2011_GWF2_39_8 TaxID=1618642 RepID=A0A0G0PWT1_9BACT|nr:MAG: type II secretion system protein E [Parcubacteria group bacterium GW2011_GWE2_39_37]KKR32589.1 MAG: type II secretion system protein E [Candidatus Falkowbacteria bacterium GW2011_GWF2_39_8]